MPHDVFLSYSSKDKNVADAACALLETRGVRCWMAPRDILPGSEWGAAIIEAISKARVMVLIYTSSSNASPQVRREVERAVARGLHVIPFRVEDVPMSPALEYFISTPHWLDALNPPLERHLDHLARIIKAVLDAQGVSGPMSPAGGAFDATPAAETGWSHGPPPGALGAAQAPAPAANGKPAAKKLVAAGAGAVVVIGAAVAVFVASKSGESDKAVSNAGVAATTAAVAPREPVTTPAVEAKVSPPAKPEPASVGAEAPPVASVPAQPTERELREFWDDVAEGDVRELHVRERLEMYPALLEQKNAAGNTPLYEAARGDEPALVILLLGRGADRKALSAGNNTALHGAAAAGLASDVQVNALAIPEAVNARNADGDTPLHLAVKAGHDKTARVILKARPDVNAPDKSGRTPLQLALALTDPAQSRDMALALVGAGAKADAAASPGGATPLHAAAARGDAALLGAMLERGAKVTVNGPGGRTPLHLAVLSKQPQAVKVLATAKGAAVEAADNQGSTPLHLAAALPETAVAEALLAAGAKVATSTKEKQTPLHAAAAAGNAAMVELFMRHGGAEVLTKGKPPSPVDVAEQAGKKDVAALLRRLEFPAMLRQAIAAADQPVSPRLLEMIRKDSRLAGASEPDGRNALHECAAAGNAAFATELVKINPALVKEITGAEETPLHVAAQYKQAAVAKVLLAGGASVRATTRAGDTPLHTAARSGAAEVIKVLLDAGADPDAANRDSNRPAEVAANAAIKNQLAAAEKEASVLRDAWSALDITGRGFDVTGPGLKQPVRIRFERTSFSMEGDVGGSFKTFAGTYTKGPLTLAMESPEGQIFPGIAGTRYAGKAVVNDDRTGFTLKAGADEIRFVRR